MKLAQQIANRIAQGDRDFGRVKVNQQGRYFQLGYTHEAQYSGDFTDVERVCRGLIVRDDGKIMAWPMEKFFNLGEPQCPALPDEPYTIWEKIDGSLGIFWHDGVDWRCNTRGAFENEYVTFAMQEWWSKYYDDDFSTNYTVMCEICIDGDENPRAAYKPQGLYLLAVRNRDVGYEMPIQNIQTQMPKAAQVSGTIDDLLNSRDTLTDTEGWVVRFESGFRVKIKTAWYLRVFKAINQMTPKAIREMMVSGGEWLNDFPDDLRPDAIKIRDGILRTFRKNVIEIQDAWTAIGITKTRKEYARAVMRDYKHLSRWLFKMYDAKFDKKELLQKMDLEATQ